MSPIKNLLFAIITGVIFTAACTNESSLDSVKVAEIESEVLNEESSPPIDVCEPFDVPGVAFPRQEYIEGPRAVMAAELVGDLGARLLLGIQ